jgi:predicted kinase
LQLAENLHVHILWIEITASEPTIRGRVSKSRPYTEADFHVYQKVKGEFEPLPAGHLVLDSETLDVEGMVHLAQAYIRGVNATHG